MLYQLPIVDFEDPNIYCLEQNSIGKRPKDFKASDFPCCILNNTQFQKTSHENKEKS